MASASENTPLLADSEPLEAGEYTALQIQNDAIATPNEEKPPYYRTTVVLTHLSAALSIVAFVFDLTGLSIDSASPGGFYLFWDLRWFMQILFGTSIITLIFSSLNLVRLRKAGRPLWLLVNLVVDGAIIFYTAGAGPQALALDFDINPSSWLPDERTETTVKAVIVILGIGIIAGLLAGLVHLIMFPLRCYVAFVSGSWRTWRVPTGEFKIEFSVKFLRQEERERAEASDAVAEA